MLMGFLNLIPVGLWVLVIWWSWKEHKKIMQVMFENVTQNELMRQEYEKEFSRMIAEMNNSILIFKQESVKHLC